MLYFAENVINPIGKGPVDGGKLKQIQKQEKRKQEIDASMQKMMEQHPEELTDYAREFGRPADGQRDAAEWWYPEKQLQDDLKTMYAGIEKTVNGPCRRRGFRDVTNVSTEDLPWEEIPEPVLEPFDFWPTLSVQMIFECRGNDGNWKSRRAENAECVIL